MFRATWRGDNSAIGPKNPRRRLFLPIWEKLAVWPQPLYSFGIKQGEVQQLRLGLRSGIKIDGGQRQMGQSRAGIKVQAVLAASLRAPEGLWLALW